MLKKSAKAKPLKKQGKHENGSIPSKGPTLGPYSQVPEHLLHPCPPSPSPPPSDFLVCRRGAAGAVYQIG
jgi:hypothetical protein